MAYLVTSQNPKLPLGDPPHDLVLSPPPAVAGYSCASDGPVLTLEWSVPGGEPQSLLYKHGGLRYHDVLLLNDFLYREACYEILPGTPVEDVLPLLGNIVPVRYALRYCTDADQRAEIDTALQHVEQLQPAQAHAIGYALAWWMEGTRCRFDEHRITVLRMAFERIWRGCRAEIEAALAHVKAHVETVDGAAIGEPLLQGYLVVSRHLRNAAVHDARLDPDDGLEVGLADNCVKAQVNSIRSWARWADWAPGIEAKVHSAFAADCCETASAGIDFFQFILYCVLLRLLSLPVAALEFNHPVEPPTGWADVATYLHDLKFT